MTDERWHFFINFIIDLVIDFINLILKESFCILEFVAVFIKMQRS